MRTESFFKILAYDERAEFIKAHLKSGQRSTGVPRYDRCTGSSPAPGVGMSFLKNCEVLPPYSQTRNREKEFEPGRILQSHLNVISKVFKFFLPEAFKEQIMDPERKDRLFCYMLKLPTASGGDYVLGFVLTDEHDRRVNSIFTGETPDEEVIFNDMRDRVSWADNGFDPLPDLEARFKAFEGDLTAATDVIVSHGVQVVLPGFVNDKGYTYMQARDEGHVYGLPAGDQDVLRGIKASSIEELAAILVIRDELGMKRLNNETNFDYAPSIS